MLQEEDPEKARKWEVSWYYYTVCEMSRVCCYGFLLLLQQREHKKQMRKLLNPKVKSVKMKMK